MKAKASNGSVSVEFECDVIDLKGSDMIIAYIDVGDLPAFEAYEHVKRFSKPLCRAVSDWIPERQVVCIPTRKGRDALTVEGLDEKGLRTLSKQVDDLKGVLDDRIATLESSER